MLNTKEIIIKLNEILQLNNNRYRQIINKKLIVANFSIFLIAIEIYIIDLQII